MDAPTSAALTAAYRRRVEAWQDMTPDVAEGGRDRALADLALLDELAAHTGDHALRGAALLALTTALDELGENELAVLTRRVAARFAAWADADR